MRLNPCCCCHCSVVVGAVMVMAMSQHVWMHHGCDGGDFFMQCYAVYIIVSTVFFLKKEEKRILNLKT